MAQRILKAIDRIAADPESRPAEADVPGLPAGAAARRMAVSGYLIRYIYPCRIDREPSVLILSVRRGSREALADPEYILRWLEERSRRS